MPSVSVHTSEQTRLTVPRLASTGALNFNSPLFGIERKGFTESVSPRVDGDVRMDVEDAGLAVACARYRDVLFDGMRPSEPRNSHVRLRRSSTSFERLSRTSLSSHP